MTTLADLAKASGKPSTAKAAPLAPEVVKSLKQLDTTGRQITKAQPKLADLVNQMKAGTHEKAPGGVLAFTHRIPVVGSVAKVFEKPIQGAFNVLDTPRAIVASTVKELQDIGYTRENPEGGSIKEWWNQIYHPKERVTGAKLIETNLRSAPVGPTMGMSKEEVDKLLQNKGVKLALGIGGIATDIAIDPLMYTGVGEAGEVAKGANAAWTKLATKGLSKPQLAEKVFERGKLLQEVGGTTEKEMLSVLERVGKQGKAGLTDADRALYNIPKLEMKFGPQGLRAGIPGSEKALEAIGKVTGPLGEAVGGGKLGNIGRTISKSGVERAALEKIASGEGERIVEGIGQRAELLANRAGQRHLTDRLIRIAKKSGLLKDASEDGAALIHAVETGSTQGLAPEVRKVFRTMKDVGAEHGVALNDLGVDFIPHQITKEGRKIVQKLKGEEGVLTRDTLESTGGAVGPERFRKLTAGYENKTLFGPGPLQTGTIEEINTRFAAKHGAPLFETDLPHVIGSYAEALGHAAGRNAGAERLVEMGLAKPIGERLTDVRGTPLIKDMAKTATEAQADALKLHDKASKAVQRLTETGKREEGIQSALDALGAVRQGAPLHPTMAADVAAKEATAVKALAETRAEGLTAREAADKLGEKALDAKAAAEGHTDDLQDALYGTNAAQTRRNTAIATAASKSPHPQVAMNGKVEQWALDMEAKLGNTAPTFDQVKDILANAPARDVIAKGIEDGYAVLAKGYQAPEDLVEALKVVQKVRDPQWWDGLMRHYDQFNNYFKAWAVASPGFLVRNLYSGVFNNFVHDVPFADHVAFGKMFKVYKEDPLRYMDILTKEVGVEQAKQFQQALKASAATGMGQGRDEVLRQIGRPKHFGVNPFKADNWYTRVMSKPNEDIEAILRGADALHNLRQGKSLAETIGSITKYHFNYTDLSDFDRKAKRVIPFWVFTARNVPLQLQIMATEPFRLNTINTFKKNLESLSPPEDIVPSYFGEENAIRLPFKLPGAGGTNYFVPDLPLMRLNETLTHFTDPVRVFSDANPAIKAVIERYADKQLFSDIPYNNTLKEAPNWSKIPGVKEALQRFGLVQYAKQGKGTPLMTDKTQVTLEGLMPELARVSRLLPFAGGQQKYKDRALTSWLSFLGSGFATNTPNTQQGELLRRQKEMDELVKQLKDRGFIKKKKPGEKRPVA